MVRVAYTGDAMHGAEEKYRAIIRRTYKITEDTWGYSNLIYEQVKVKDEYKHQSPPGSPGYFNGISPQNIIGAIFSPDWVQVPRGYICFKDEADALQFRLSVDTSSIQVYMWPETLFTIHEFVYTDEQ
jgi:hypothetical protein